VDPSRDGGGGLTSTGLFCGACGAQSSPTAKFCGECGTRLTQANQPAEFKQVTVLFADVVQSMDIAATVGAERLREIMTELVNRASAVVQRYGGTVDKFTGDGIMAVFGAPVALEDHAIRACLAALDIQEETGRLATEVTTPEGAAAGGADTPAECHNRHAPTSHIGRIRPRQPRPGRGIRPTRCPTAAAIWHMLAGQR
jgi:adenylate cyclase